jgi:hypothetical protein
MHERERSVCEVLLANLMESSYIKKLCVDECRKEYDGMAELDLSSSEVGQLVGIS